MQLHKVTLYPPPILSGLLSKMRNSDPDLSKLISILHPPSEENYFPSPVGFIYEIPAAAEFGANIIDKF